MCGAVRSKFKLELMNRILRECAYGTALGMCSLSGAPLYVYDACMCASTAVDMCSPSGITVVVRTCMRACTAFGVHGPSTCRAEVRVRGVLAPCSACAISAV